MAAAMDSLQNGVDDGNRTRVSAPSGTDARPAITSANCGHRKVLVRAIDRNRARIRRVFRATNASATRRIIRSSLRSTAVVNATVASCLQAAFGIFVAVNYE